MTIVVDCTSWRDFLVRLDDFFEKSALTRLGWVFRGHADAGWALESTLARQAGRTIDAQSLDARLREQFQREAPRAGVNLPGPEDLDSWNMVARHHGLPSPILDWTRSPYVALYFAACDRSHNGPNPPTQMAVWALDLTRIAGDSDAGWHVVDEVSGLRWNSRAVEQQAVFVRTPFAKIEPPTASLVKYVLPAAGVRDLLQRLYSMGISHASLFRTLDAAAQTATVQATALQWKKAHELREATGPFRAGLAA